MCTHSHTPLHSVLLFTNSLCYCCWYFSGMPCAQFVEWNCVIRLALRISEGCQQLIVTLHSHHSHHFPACTVVHLWRSIWHLRSAGRTSAVFILWWIIFTAHHCYYLCLISVNNWLANQLSHSLALCNTSDIKVWIPSILYLSLLILKCTKMNYLAIPFSKHGHCTYLIIFNITRTIHVSLYEIIYYIILSDGHQLLLK